MTKDSMVSLVVTAKGSWDCPRLEKAAMVAGVSAVRRSDEMSRAAVQGSFARGGRRRRALERGVTLIEVMIVVVILGLIATILLTSRGLGAASLSDGITSTEDLSRVLFHELLLPFEVTSVLILIAILGSVALARHGHGDSHGEPDSVSNRELATRERTAAK